MAATVSLANATTLEGQAAELMREIQQAEDAWVAAGLALTPPVQRQRRLTTGFNLTTGVVTYSLNLPISVADAIDGYSIEAATYLP